MLKEAGINCGRFTLAPTRAEAEKAAQDLGFPVVMKIVSDQIIHKTEAGGLRLNIRNQAEAGAAFDELLASAKNYNAEAVIKGVLVTPMAPKGVEVIVGGLRDPQFGPVVMFGLGGIFVEIFKDVQFRLAPLNPKEALTLIKSIQAFPMLEGARGQKAVNLTALAGLIVAAGQYLADNGQVGEIDLNPVLCYDDQAEALDAVIGVTL
ncbi:MAG: acetate--CoA ligase family protein [Candidatus Adiutrix sp.]|jgi:acetyl-CoA synthetase (ADP-forming)|nr:acetate--CoA ligase family protein [Candidatus Adiutrix sp.]